MLKIKKKFHLLKKNQNEEAQLHEEIKNSIKNLYLRDQKNKKTVNDYVQLLTKIRNEYVILQKENNQLKIGLEKRTNCFENLPKFPRKSDYIQPTRNIYKKRKQFYYDDYEDSEESDSYTTEVQRRPKRKKNYEDEIDGIPEYEPHSSTESE